MFYKINLLFSFFFKFSMVAPTLLPSEWLIPTKWKFKVSSRVLWQKRWIMAELWIQQSRFILNAYLILLWRYVFPPCVERTSVFSSNFSMPGTGKSWSEALIFASTNPQYDNRLFNVHENTCRTCRVHKLLFFFCFDIQNIYSTQYVLQMLWASEKDLPVFE